MRTQSKGAPAVLGSYSERYASSYSSGCRQQTTNISNVRTAQQSTSCRCQVFFNCLKKLSWGCPLRAGGNRA